MKYIDADLLKAKIERRIKYIADNEESLYEPFGKTCELKECLAFLDTLESEEPKGLEEAAESYEGWADTYNTVDYPTYCSVRDAFKAGAEWMANQGVTKEVTIGMATKSHISKETLDALDAGIGDKLIIQIRKKYAG